MMTKNEITELLQKALVDDDGTDAEIAESKKAIIMLAAQIIFDLHRIADAVERN